MTIGYVEVLASGEIVTSGYCAEDVLHLQQPLFGGTIVTVNVDTLSAVSGHTHIFRDGEFVERPALAPDLDAERAKAVSAIDTEAEALRAMFITPGAGQSLVYTQKLREAEALMADPALSLAALPHLSAEAAMNGIKPFDQAVRYLTLSHEWGKASALIETIRLGAKAAIVKAESLDQIRTVAADWSPVHYLVRSGEPS